VLFTMFEGTRISLAWRRLSENADLVVVPTRASWEAWASRGFPEARLRLCPLGVDPLPAVTAADFPTTGLPSSLADIRGRPLSTVSRRILNISDLVPRKNLDGLLRVWLRATVAADDAVLILKFGKGGGAAQAAFQSLLRASEAAVGRRLDEAAPIAVIDETLDEDGMNGLFRVATHYWSLSHGEGWDLPMSKAGAMGLELVAPRHSAYPEYLDDSTARLIPSTTGPAHRPYSRESWAPFFGLDWWEPDEDVAADIIGRIVRGEDDRRLDARSHLLARFTWDHATDALLTVLRDCRAL
jgi:glycosyltransferase involved in cell wall biosynthesis